MIQENFLMTIHKAVLVFLVLISVACVLGAAPDNASGGNDMATRLSFPYTQGWLGADDAYSIPFAHGKSIWLFGDTFAGDVSNMDRNKTPMVRNSVGVTTCVPDKPCTIQYYWKNQKSANPRSFFDTGKEDEWYWPLDGYLEGNTLYVSLMIVRNKPNAGPADPFGFEIAGTRWAKITNALAAPDQWKISIRDLTPRELWPGSSIVRDGEFVLFYTQASQGEGKGYMIVLRVPVSKIENPGKNWEYLGKDGKWHGGLPQSDAQHVIDQAISEMSVRYHPSTKKWVAISPGIEFPSKRIIARTADSPIGPWSSPQDIFEFPEMKSANPIYDKDTFCYATKEHTEFEDSNIVLTYACNSNVIAKVMNNLNLYRPQVVVLEVPK
jgi:Domain of unknown function (DUF4185)